MNLLFGHFLFFSCLTIPVIVPFFYDYTIILFGLFFINMYELFIKEKTMNLNVTAF